MKTDCKDTACRSIKKVGQVLACSGLLGVVLCLVADIIPVFTPLLPGGQHLLHSFSLPVAIGVTTIGVCIYIFGRRSEGRSLHRRAGTWVTVEQNGKQALHNVEVDNADADELDP